jgi:hypothetical protein
MGGQNIKFGFKACEIICLLNLKAMEHIHNPSNIYITPSISDNDEGEEDYSLNHEEVTTQQWEE